MSEALKLISSEYLSDYQKEWNQNFDKILDELQGKSHFSTEDFEYYIIASSLFSSKIEGNSLDFNSFYGNRNKPGYPRTKEIEEIENLAETYKFASENIFR